MQYDIRYTSFNGEAGTDRLDNLEELPAWLWKRPGAHILDIAPVVTPTTEKKAIRECREKALAKFAEGILDSLQNYRGG